MSRPRWISSHSRTEGGGGSKPSKALAMGVVAVCLALGIESTPLYAQWGALARGFGRGASSAGRAAGGAASAARVGAELGGLGSSASRASSFARVPANVRARLPANMLLVEGVAAPELVAPAYRTEVRSLATRLQNGENPNVILQGLRETTSGVLVPNDVRVSANLLRDTIQKHGDTVGSLRKQLESLRKVRDFSRSEPSLSGRDPTSAPEWRSVKVEELPPSVRDPARQLHAIDELRFLTREGRPLEAELTSIQQLAKDLESIHNSTDLSQIAQARQELAAKAFLEGKPDIANTLLPDGGPPENAGALLRDMKAIVLGESQTPSRTWAAQQLDPTLQEPPQGLLILAPEGSANGWHPPPRGRLSQELPTLKDLNTEIDARARISKDAPDTEQSVQTQLQQEQQSFSRMIAESVRHLGQGHASFGAPSTDEDERQRRERSLPRHSDGLPGYLPSRVPTPFDPMESFLNNDPNRVVIPGIPSSGSGQRELLERMRFPGMPGFPGHSMPGTFNRNPLGPRSGIDGNPGGIPQPGRYVPGSSLGRGFP